MNNDIVEATKLIVPAWFRFEPGFAWFDDDGDFCMLLGFAQQHQVLGDIIAVQAPGNVSYVAQCYSYAAAVVYVHWRKNTWHMCELGALTPKVWAVSEPCPLDHPIRQRLGAGDTFKYMKKDCDEQEKG